MSVLASLSLSYCGIHVDVINNHRFSVRNEVRMRPIVAAIRAQNKLSSVSSARFRHLPPLPYSPEIDHDFSLGEMWNDRARQRFELIQPQRMCTYEAQARSLLRRGGWGRENMKWNSIRWPFINNLAQDKWMGNRRHMKWVWSDGSQIWWERLDVKRRLQTNGFFPSHAFDVITKYYW